MTSATAAVRPWSLSTFAASAASVSGEVHTHVLTPKRRVIWSPFPPGPADHRHAAACRRSAGGRCASAVLPRRREARQVLAAELGVVQAGHVGVAVEEVVAV